MWDALWTGLDAATLPRNGGGLGLLRDAAIGVAGGHVAWVGPRATLPGEPARLARVVHEAGGRLATPGLIDCHTHLVFGGHRAAEFERRTAGEGYAAISAAGGGIRSTIAATALLDVAGLAAAALPRARALRAEGVTTLEVKSGYGADAAGELAMLRAVQALARELDAELIPTLLALHAPPADGDRAAHLRRVIDELLPAAARGHLARAVDVFCEGIAYSVPECRAVLRAAQALGLGAHVHADQLSCMGAARLAGEEGALSADHLEYTDEAGVAALARSGTVAVLLPVAFLVTGESRKPPVAALRAAGVPLAVATDCNPGTAPCASIGVALALARAQFGLTATEALRGVTCEAARALGLGDRGSIEVGQRADLCLWDITPDEFGYWVGPLAPWQVTRG